MKLQKIITIMQTIIANRERKIALVHDYLAQAGGAERVVVAWNELFAGAPLYYFRVRPQENASIIF